MDMGCGVARDEMIQAEHTAMPLLAMRMRLMTVVPPKCRTNSSTVATWREGGNV